MVRAKVSRDALSDRAYEMLRAQIIDHRLAPGERLTMERLTAALDVSHTPIREALNRLVSERLVSVEAYRGFRVTELLDADELRQLFDARLVIEQGALRTATSRIDDDALAEIGRIVEKMDGVASAPTLDVNAFNELDAQFHRATVAAGGNVFLLNAFDDLKVHVQVARHYRGRSIGEAREAQAEHHDILDALARSDSAALLRHAATHVENVFRRLQQPDGDQPTTDQPAADPAEAAR